MRVGRYRFRPSLVPTLATVVTLPLLIALGFWQLDRAEQRQQRIDAYHARSAAPPIPVNEEGVPEAGSDPREAEAVGRFDAERSLLLDNQTRGGEVGYHVLTPFRLEGREEAVLVDRGWIAGGDTRAELPDVAVSPEPRRIRGHLDDGPPTGIRLGAMAEADRGWPLRIQYLDMAALGERLGYPLAPQVLRLDPDAPGGYVREWEPAFREGYGPERNLGYAVQWFGLAAALVVIFIVVNLKRKPRDDSH